ncbi:MAG TPA: DUF819 family protein, partial [Saprospiraceae bacterium]|nr:DUF819 family protein [Saprospiraceae bacterium]
MTQPFFTNDATVLGLLIIVLALVFATASSSSPAWKKFYTYVPSLLLCYFLPALLHWPLGLIAPEWYDLDKLRQLLQEGVAPNLSENAGWREMKQVVMDNQMDKSLLKGAVVKSELYHMSSRYLLPASLILLCLSIDFKGIVNLGPKALIMFFAATLGIILGGPVALLIISYVAPGIISAGPDEIWRGLSTVAGSWIGGGANQNPMKKIFNGYHQFFFSVINVGGVGAEILMGF